MAEAITLNPVKKDPYSDEEEEPLISFSKKTKKKPIKQEVKPIIPKKEPKREAGSDLDDEEEVPISLLGKKKSMINKKVANGDLSKEVKVEGKKLSKVKKEEVEDEYFEQGKPLKKNRKEEVKRKKKKSTSGKSTEANSREKKVYSLPGQKFDPPEERDPLRIFYETLHQQVPSSEMAAIWMMERGLLPEKEAAIVYAKKQKSKQQQIKSPVKVASAGKMVKVSPKKPKEEPKESPAKSKSKPTKKRKANDDSGAEDDFILPLKKPRN